MGVSDGTELPTDTELYEAKVREAFNFFDRDQTGQVQVSDLLSLLRCCDVKPLQKDAQAFNMFERVEQAPPGMVNVERLIETLTKMGEPMSDTDVQAMYPLLKELTVEKDNERMVHFMPLIERLVGKH